MIDNQIEFNPNEYLLAAKERLQDAHNQEISFSFQLYSYGVAIESILKGHAAKFDGKHDLFKLLEKSTIPQKLNETSKADLAANIKMANKIWNNNLRWSSDKRLSRAINSYFMTHPKDRISITEAKIKLISNLAKIASLIVKTGEKK
jgi:hypothetical protein